jgi:hypothetical protein
MGSTSIIDGEVVATTSPVEAAPPASAAHGGFSTLASATGGEVALLSTAPRGGVAVCASSASTSRCHLTARVRVGSNVAQGFDAHAQEEHDVERRC